MDLVTENCSRHWINLVTFIPHQKEYVYFPHKKDQILFANPKENNETTIIHYAVVWQLLLLIYHQQV